MIQKNQSKKQTNKTQDKTKEAIIKVLKRALNQHGDSYMDISETLTKTSQLLHVNTYDNIARNLITLLQENKIVIKQNKIALTYVYQTENAIAFLLKQLLNNNSTIQYDQETLNIAISNAENELGIEYDKTQKSAIKNAVTQPISILTGGPGTGKTTIINGILSVIEQLNSTNTVLDDDSPMLLAAPTGRAAKRMSETTGKNATTIHRLIGLGLDDKTRGALNELNGEILIIDEMSMVDMFLFKNLLSAINNVYHIVFVGDKDQLPSVGAGNVFSDLINSHVFPTTTLNQIHRQKGNSSIVTLAQNVNNGVNEQSMFTKRKNCSFIAVKPDQIGKAIAKVTTIALKHGIAKDDIQVLSAMYRGYGGVDETNSIMQKIMNPNTNESKKEITTKKETFREGDRVLQLINNPEKEIYNGQIGKIISINNESKSKCMIAEFDSQKVALSCKDLTNLTKAYAITIHKSQGSEFPLVILDLTQQNYAMLKRNLLYTAITRAKKNLVLIGDYKAFNQAFNAMGNNRKTGLVQKLQKAI